MKITGFPLSIVFLSISFPFYKRKNEAQRNKEWKQWENDEKPRKHIKKWWNIGKNEHNEKMMKNGEKAMKNGEKQETNENNWRTMKPFFFFSTTCGRLPLHTKMAHDLGERWKLPCFLYLQFSFQFPFLFIREKMKHRETKNENNEKKMKNEKKQWKNEHNEK